MAKHWIYINYLVLLSLLTFLYCYPKHVDYELERTNGGAIGTHCELFWIIFSFVLDEETPNL